MSVECLREGEGVGDGSHSFSGLVAAGDFGLSAWAAGIEVHAASGEGEKDG